MSALALALHGGATGGLPLDAYLGRIQAAGIGAIEWCLPPAWDAAALAELAAALPALARLGMPAHVRCPSPAAPDAAWQALAALAARIADQHGRPARLVLEAAGGDRPAEDDQRQATAAAARRLAELCGAAARPVIRLGVAPGRRSLGGQLRQWWAHRREERGRIAPPPGTVRPGLGGPRLTVDKPAGNPPGASADAPLDPPPPPYGAAASRAALLATVAATGGAAGLCWDLGRDWLTGVLGGQPGWTTLPEPPFLAAVEHLEVCDALPAGHGQMPLIPGNVPYTTQLRALAGRAPLPAATLDIAYGDLALRLGDRFQTLARSVTIIQRALRLSV